MTASLPVHAHPPALDWYRIAAALAGSGALMAVATHDGLALTHHGMAQETAETLSSAAPIRLADRQGWLALSPATAGTALITRAGPDQRVDQVDVRISRAMDTLEGLLPSTLPDRVGRMRVYRSVA